MREAPSGVVLAETSWIDRLTAEEFATRTELFVQTDKRQQIRAHDLRASFITVSLALGKSETWVADRTGHTSSVMINRYRRKARQVAQLNLGPFLPLDEIIPELAALADPPVLAVVQSEAT